MMPIPLNRMGYGGEDSKGGLRRCGDDLSSFIDRDAEDDLRFGDWGLRTDNRCQSHPHRYIGASGVKGCQPFTKLCTPYSEVMACP